MSTDRIARVNTLIQREIGTALYRHINDERFDPALVTITHVETARNLRTAKVHVSINAPEETQRMMMNLIRHARAEIQAMINTDLHIKYTPVLHFEIDHGIQKGDHVLEVLSQLADDTPADAAPFEPDAS